MKLPHPPILLVTDRKQAQLPLADVIEAALSAGCRWLSLREKDLTVEEELSLARKLLPIARRHAAIFTSHGDPERALAAELDGVHLGAGGDVVKARKVLGPHGLIGLSVHTADEARRAEVSKVDYLIAGPAFETESKPGYGPPLGVEGLRAIVQAAHVPVIAIGGVSRANAGAIRATGAAGLAVMGGVMRASAPGVEMRSLLEALAA